MCLARSFFSSRIEAQLDTGATQAARILTGCCWLCAESGANRTAAAARIESLSRRIRYPPCCRGLRTNLAETCRPVIVSPVGHCVSSCELSDKRPGFHAAASGRPFIVWNAFMNKMVAPEKNRTGEKNQVQVIARAAAILRALEDAAPGLSLGQIAQRVNLARSTVQRIVGALEAERLVIAASPTGLVRLAPTILRLAASVRTDFVSLARPFIVKLSNELRETVDLATVKRDQLVFIDQVIGSHRLRTVSAVGETFPLYCTANGKAYLAELDDAEIEQLIGRAYEGR